MAATYLASAALMAVLVVAVVVAAARGRGWYQYAPRVAGEGGAWPRERDERPALLARPGTWVVVFVATAVVAIGGVFAIVTGEDSASLANPGVLTIGALVVVYLVLGVYVVGRDRGHSHAMALGEAGVVAGSLFLLGVVTQLLV